MHAFSKPLNQRSISPPKSIKSSPSVSSEIKIPTEAKKVPIRAVRDASGKWTGPAIDEKKQKMKQQKQDVIQVKDLDINELERLLSDLIIESSSKK